MARSEQEGYTYSLRHLVMINRLVPAWITEDFEPVSDIINALGTTQPESAWSPDGAHLPDDRLRAMHRIWRSHAEGGNLPRADRCVVDSFGRLVDVMMFLDFRDDGLSLSYRHYGAELTLHSGTNWQGRTTVDMAGFSDYSLLFATSYVASAVLRESLYTELVSAPKLVSTTWCRYLMPYVNEAGKVVSFACANVPVPGLPSWPPVTGRAQLTKSHGPAAVPVLHRDTAHSLINAERNVRELLEHAPVAVMVVKADSRRVYFVNEAMAALLGYSPESMSATDPGVYFWDAEIFHGAFKVHEGEDGLHDAEIRLRPKDSRDVWAVMSTDRIIFDNNKSVVFWLYDISARKVAEAGKLQAERQQEATIRQLRKAQTELKKLADRDPLTDLPNRRYFDEIALHEFERARRRASVHGVLMIDIDLFKLVNDTYGHPAGDEVLRTVAATLDSGRRKSDTLARIGGEEFLLLLPDTDAEGTVFVAEKLRHAVEACITTWEHIELAVTVSIGASILTSSDMSMASIVKRSDDALYEAKRTGRNRVVFV